MKTSIVCFLCLTIICLSEPLCGQQRLAAVDSSGRIAPPAVLLRSLVLPGWGQVTNRQYWKVPVVYGAIGGLVWYNRIQAGYYKEYRAAYYNLNNPGGDQRFGPTPSRLAGITSGGQLRSARDLYRNRRDISYVYIALAYGFGALDAYIWAHLRMFDVSDNLSLAPVLVADPLLGPVPAAAVKIRF